MKSNLVKRGFLSLLVTQFFGAANDNVLKQVLTFMIATGIWSQGLGEGGLGEGGQVVPALFLALPFVLLSGFAGQVADRHSKRRVMLAVKIAEVPIVLVAMIGFLTQNLWITLLAMLLLAIQSTFFGPAKYGVIPELVESRDLSRANGALNMFTNIAIIAGSVAAGPLADLFDPKPGEDGVVPEPVLWVPGVGLAAIALLGLAAVLFMPKLAPSDPNLRYTFNPFSTYIKSLKEMARGPLIIVAMAWAFFSMIGIMALLILPEYEQILNIKYTQNSYLFATLGVSIGVGSVLAGLISGHHIKPRLIPIGAVGMTVFFILLGGLKPDYYTVGALLFGAGIFAGFYIVPLQALLQRLSPENERGQFLGTANGLSFCFVTAGCGVYWIATNRLGVPPNRVFLICGGLAVVGTGFALLRLRGYLREHAVV